MSAYDWAVVLAVGALLIVASSYRRHDTSDHDAWQQSTNSNPQTVADNVAEARKDREIAQLEAWLQLPLQPGNTIPNQTRRTEDNQ